MKKWYVITGILALLCLISLGTCSSNSAKVNELTGELSDVRGRLADVSAELVVAKQDLFHAEAELEDTKVELDVLEAVQPGIESQLIEAEQQLADREGELERVRADLAQLKATKELVFGNGLKIFDIEYYNEWFNSSVKGKVQNTSSEPMKTVKILTVAWNEDGSLYGTEIETIDDLFPQEIAEWQSWVYGEGKEVAIYAFGNRSE